MIYLQLTFDVGVVTIFGRRLADHVKEQLREHYLIVEKGYNSFPIPVPFTSYSQAIKVCIRPRRARGFLFFFPPILFSKQGRQINGARDRSHPFVTMSPNRLLLMHACRRGGGWARS